MANQSIYWFAWVGSGETVFNASHMREDELIFSFELKHDEGQFAELEIEVVNPRVGLLAPGRPLWAWFSWHDGNTVHPLFFGRLVAVPDDLFQDIIKLKLVARPLSYASQRRAVADSLKVLPYYDPIFIADSKLDDPDTALEGYSALWHVDRTSHAVTASDIINGEDGTAVFTQDDAFYDQLTMKISGAPLLLCEISAEVSWTQCDHTGTYEMKTVPNTEDLSASDANSSDFLGTGMSVKVQNSPKDKPQAPKDEIQTTYSWEYKNVTPGPHSDGDLMEESGSRTEPYYGGDLIRQDKFSQNADKETGTGEEYSIKESYKYTWNYQPPTPEQEPTGGGDGGGGGSSTPSIDTAKKEVAVEVEQDRVEQMYVAMRADVQPVLASLIEDQEDLLESFSMSARDLVDAGVVSPSAGSYFATERGQQSVEYMLMVARAHLLAASRVVEIEWECPFNRVVDLSCRKNSLIYDERLPGGAAFGKIVSYEMTGNGDDGEFIGKVTINCSVGNGGVVGGRAAGDIVAIGTPVYVEEGYVSYGYQHYIGRMVKAASNDVAYSPVEFQAVGLQLPITEDQILVRHEYHDGMANGDVFATIQSTSAQLRELTVGPIGEMITSLPQSVTDYSAAEARANQIIAQALQDNPSWVEMEFRPTKGIQVRANYAADVSELTLPMQIDLSAPAT